MASKSMGLILVALLAIMLLGGVLFTKNPVSDALKNWFKGGTDNASAKVIGTPETAIKNHYEGKQPEKTSIAIKVQPGRFKPENGEKIRISVSNETSTKQEKIIVYLTDKKNKAKYYISKDTTLNGSTSTSFEWDGKQDGKILEAGEYIVLAAQKQEKNIVSNPKTFLLDHLSQKPRQQLIDAFPWPKDTIKVGLSPNTPTQTFTTFFDDSYSKKELNVVIPKIPKNPDGTEISPFPLPTADQIFLDGTKISDLTEAERKKIQVKINDPDATVNEQEGKPFLMTISLDYTDYFAKNPSLPQTEEHTIYIYIPSLAQSDPIKLKVSLNESGTIVFPAETTASLQATDKPAKTPAYKEIVDALSFWKGWQALEVNTDKTQIQGKIKEKYNQKPFTHLLIIGSKEQIPIVDEQGNALDSAVYGNMDNDNFAELSVGRLPLMPEELKEYYKKTTIDSAPAYSTADYVFIMQNGDDQESEKEYTRKSFLFTGFKPVFDNQNTSNQEVMATANTDSIGLKNLVDYQQPSCPDFAKLPEMFRRVVNPIYCVIETEQGTPRFFDTKTANFIGYSSTIKDMQGNKAEVKGSPVLYEHLNLAAFNEKRGKITMGETFRDYLNGTSFFYEFELPAEITKIGEPQKYILFGDPSNTIDLKGMPTDWKKASVSFDTKENKVKITMPPVNLNEIILTRGENTFSEKDIKNIEGGKFLAENATILKADFPFITEIQTKSTSSLKYSLDFVGKTNAYHTLHDFTGDAPKETVKIERHPFDWTNDEKIVLRVKKIGGSQPLDDVAEILEAPISPNWKPVPQDKQLPEGMKKENYNYQYIELGHNSKKHTDFLKATGQVNNIAKDEKTKKISFEAEFKNLPDTAPSPTLKAGRPIEFNNYAVCFEGPIKADPKTRGIECTTIFKPTNGSFKASGSVTADLIDFDKILLYGTESTSRPPSEFDMGRALFDDTPILAGDLEQGKMQNNYGFLQYEFSIVGIDLFVAKNPNTNAETETDVYAEINYYNVNPFIGGKNEIILLASDNTKYQTESVKEFVLQLKQSLYKDDGTVSDKQKMDKITEMEQAGGIVAVSAFRFWGLKNIFAEKAHFLSNYWAFMQFYYPQGVSNKTISGAAGSKDFLKATVKAKKEGDKPIIERDGIIDGADLRKTLAAQNVSLLYEFGLKDLFELMKAGYSHEPYTIEFGPFEKNIATTTGATQTEQQTGNEQTTGQSGQSSGSGKGLTAAAEKAFNERFIKVSNYKGLNGWFDKQTQRIWYPELEEQSCPTYYETPNIENFQSIGVDATYLYGSNLQANDAGVWPLFDKRIKTTDFFLFPKAKVGILYAGFNQNGTLNEKDTITTHRQQPNGEFLPFEKSWTMCISSPSIKITERELGEQQGVTQGQETPAVEITKIELGTTLVWANLGAKNAQGIISRQNIGNQFLVFYIKTNSGNFSRIDIYSDNGTLVASAPKSQSNPETYVIPSTKTLAELIQDTKTSISFCVTIVAQSGADQCTGHAGLQIS